MKTCILLHKSFYVFPHQLGRGSELKHFSLLLTEWEESESIGNREMCDQKSLNYFFHALYCVLSDFHMWPFNQCQPTLLFEYNNGILII